MTHSFPTRIASDVGVLAEHRLLAQCVWFDDEEIDAVLGSGTAIAYCPWAYLRLGQGLTANGRHAEISLRGGRIALGCDATNAPDTVAILRQAALATGLAKDTNIDPTWFCAHHALDGATTAAAPAVGRASRTGAPEAGTRADPV